jgi:hypothetical protein
LDDIRESSTRPLRVGTVVDEVFFMDFGEVRLLSTDSKKCFSWREAEVGDFWD